MKLVPLRVAFVNQLRSGMLRAADSRMRDSTLTLLQVLLVVPRFLLFGHEFLHCAGAEHGTDRSALEKQAPPCVCASVCEYGLEQWSSERQRRRLLQGGAASAPAGWGVLLLSVGASSTCFLLSLIRSLPPFIPSTAWSEAPQMLGLLQTWQRCCNSSTSFSPPPPPSVISCAHAVPSRAARQMHDRAFLPTTPTRGPGPSQACPLRQWSVR